MCARHAFFTSNPEITHDPYWGTLAIAEHYDIVGNRAFLILAFEPLL